MFLSWFDSLWGSLCFSVAYIAVVIATASLIGTLLKSVVSTKTCRDIRKKTRDRGWPVWLGGLKILALRLLIVVMMISIGLGLSYVVHLFQVRFELKLPEGILYPAKDPMPSAPCVSSNLLRDQIALFSGANIYIVNSFPHTVLKVNGKDRLVVDKNEAGAILISLDIFDSQLRLVTSIENGKFTTKPNHLFDFKRVDYSTLEILDFQGISIFKIRYLNKDAISIDAILRYPDRPNPVILDGSKTTSPGYGTISGFCIEQKGAGSSIAFE